MSSQPEDQAIALLDRLRVATNRAAKTGKQDGATLSSSIQDLLHLVASGDLQTSVVVNAFKIMEDMLANTPQAGTILRLEGGLKVLSRLLRTYTMDAAALAGCARVISRCVSNNTASQAALARERGIGSTLLSALAVHSRDGQVVLPLMELVAGLSRTLRGAQSLAGEAMVTLSRDLMLQFMGQWNVLSMILKALKLQAKHESCAACLMRVGNGDVTQMLLAVARLLARLPAQQKVLKRVSRTLWLLHRDVLPPLPDLEPVVPLPQRDAPHLGLPAASECTDSSRLMELVPEEFCAELQQAAGQAAGQTAGQAPVSPVDTLVLPPIRPARPVRATCRPDVCWPSTADLIAQQGAELPDQPAEPFHDCGSTLEIDMMMHDLRRLVYPDVSQSRLVYNNLTPGPVPPPTPSQPPPRPPGAAATKPSGAAAYSELLMNAAASSCGDQLGPAEGKQQLPTGRHSSLQPLTFDSSFESGNLRAAYQVYDNEYDLFLAADLNDRSDGGNLCQWFYFSVGNVQPGVPYKFNLVNLRKKQSLFGNGKQPLVCLVPTPQQPGGTTPSPTPGAAPANTAAAVSDPPPLPPPAPPPAVRQEPGSALVAVSGSGQWVRAGACVAYYPSPYRGRPLTPPVTTTASNNTAAGDAQTRRSACKKPPIKRAGRAGQPAPGQLPPPTPQAGATKDTSTGRDTASGAAGLELAPTGPGLYCATFTLVFPQAGTFLVASCYPYTYSRLQEYLHNLCSRLAIRSPGPCRSSTPPSDTPLASPAPSSPPAALPLLLDGVLVRSLLCYTLSGHAVELLTVTDFLAPPDVVASREVVVITARVHPGETCASWIMQGVMEFLTSRHPAACMLRSSFVFKLVPMLNPDGVVNGSYRCSLAGCDLNRTWERPCKSVQPSVYHTKKLLQALAAGGVGRLALFIDIHGHSSKEDVFFYGCEPNLSGYPGIGGSSSSSNNNTSQGRQSTPSRPSGSAGAAPDQDNQPGTAGASQQPQQQGTQGTAGAAAGGVNPRVAARLRVRMLPYLLACGSNTWSFAKSSFRIRKAKLGAARVVVHRELGCAGAYTLEASLGGRSSNRTHFSLQDYVNMGSELCRGIAELAEVDDTALLDDMAGNVTLAPYTPAYTV